MCIVGERCPAVFLDMKCQDLFHGYEKSSEGRPGDKAIFHGLRERRLLPNYLTVLLNDVCFITTALAVEKPNRDNVVEGSYQLSEDSQGISISNFNLNYFYCSVCTYYSELID